MTARLARLAMLRDSERRAGLRGLAAASRRVAALDATQARLAALLADVPVRPETTALMAAQTTRATLGAAAERVATARRAALADRAVAAHDAARLSARADAVARARSRATQAARAAATARL